MSDPNIVTAIENIAEQVEQIHTWLFLLFLACCFGLMIFCLERVFSNK